MNMIMTCSEKLPFWHWSSTQDDLRYPNRLRRNQPILYGHMQLLSITETTRDEYLQSRFGLDRV